MFLRLLIFSSLLFTFLPLAEAQEQVHIDARTSERSVALGQPFSYEIEVTVEGNYDIHLASEPDFGNLQVERTFRAPSFTIRNGQATRSLKVSYQLRASSEGQFQINPPRIVVGTRTFTPPPRQVRVIPGSSAPGSSGSTNDRTPAQDRSASTLSSDIAFLEIEIDPDRSPFVGEQIRLRYDLYLNQRNRGMRASFPGDPPLDGFWVEDIGQQRPSRRSLASRQGRTWEVTPLREMVVFPLRPGPVQIDHLDVVLQRSSFFGPDESHEVSGEPITLEVRPLPDGAPEGFHENNIGTWQISVRPDSHTTRVGGGLTVTLTLDGLGRPGRLSAPLFKENDAFRVVNQEDRFEQSLRGIRIGGTRTFTYHLMALKEGIQELPSFRFVYFDPDKEEYQVITTSPEVITVEAGELPPQEAPAPASLPEVVSVDPYDGLHDLLPEGALGPPRSPFRELPSWVFLVPLLGLLLLAIEWLLPRLKGKARQESIRRKQLFEDLQLALDSGTGPVPDRCLKVLRRGLVEGFHFSLGAVTVEELEKISPALPLNEKTRDELLRLVEELIAARYSRNSQGEKQEFLGRTTRILKALGDSEVGTDGSVLATLPLTLILLGFVGPALLAILLIPAPAFSEAEPIQWEEAAVYWLDRAQRERDPTVDYNAGTAAARNGQLGEARFFLERAHHQGARHEALRENLAIVIDLVAQESPGVARFPYPTIGRTQFSTLGIWITALALWLALFLALLLRHFKKSDFPHARFLRSLLVVALLLSFSGLILTSYCHFSPEREHAVLLTSAELKDSPSRYGRVVNGPIPEGAILRVKETHSDGWYRVELPSGSRGWLPAGAIKILE